MNTMMTAIGVINLDHVAVTTRDLVSTVKEYLSIPNSKLLRGPGKNFAQSVNFAFVDLNGVVIEILSPLHEKSPIINQLSDGGGAYHLCYTVSDIENSVAIAQNEFGAKLVVPPEADDAFDGRRVAFLVHELHGLFELLEAVPADLSTIRELNIMKVENNSIEEMLLDIYNSVVGKNYVNFEDVSMKNCSEWDSLKHLQLIMELEKQFEISISSSDLSQLTSLSDIKNYLGR